MRPKWGAGDRHMAHTKRQKQTGNSWHRLPFCVTTTPTQITLAQAVNTDVFRWIMKQSSSPCLGARVKCSEARQISLRLLEVHRNMLPG